MKLVIALGFALLLTAGCEKRQPMPMTSTDHDSYRPENAYKPKPVKDENGEVIPDVTQDVMGKDWVPPKQDGKPTKEIDHGVPMADPAPDAATKLGIDLYPGATMAQGSEVVEQSGAKSAVAAATFYTKDKPTQVRDFYMSHLTEGKSGGGVMEAMGTYVVNGKNRDGAPVLVQSILAGGRTEIKIAVQKPK
jgi:hypothetical protein